MTRNSSNMQTTPRQYGLEKITNRTPVNSILNEAFPKDSQSISPMKFAKGDCNITTPSTNQSTDILDVSQPQIINKKFTPDPRTGISVHRPEILSIINFQSIFDGDPKNNFFTPYGHFIELSHQASLVRRKRLTQLYKNLQKSNNNASKAFKEAKEKFKEEIDRANQIATFFASSLQNVELLNSYFDFKNLPDGDWILNDNERNLKEFFDAQGFKNKQFNKFTNTKILLQMLSDLRVISANYSFNLLNLQDSDRKNDYSQTKIDTTYTLVDGFTFRVWKIKSRNAGKLKSAFDSKFFQEFNRTLPRNASDRIKLLLTVLSKEFQVSTGLGNEDLFKDVLNAKFDIEDAFGNPFDTIVGEIGNTIFKPAKGDKSFAKLAHQLPELVDAPSNYNFTVLPFESKYIDDTKKKKTYIPGKDYYINSIFDIVETPTNDGNKPTFNTKPLETYVDEFSDKFGHLEEAYNGLFGFSEDNLTGTILDRKAKLKAHKIYRQMLDRLRSCTSELNEESTTQNMQGFTLAVFQLAKSDSKLKRLLFEYLVMLGFSNRTATRTDSPPGLWADMAAELGNVSSFPSVDLREGDTDWNFVQNAGWVITDRFSSGVDNLSGKLVVRLKKRIERLALGGEEGPTTATALVGFRAPVELDVVFKGILERVDQFRDHAFREFVNFVDEFSENLYSLSGGDHLISNSDKRTRFNQLSPSTVILILFEIWFNLVNTFTFTTFAKGKQEGEYIKLNFSTNTDLTNFMRTQAAVGGSGGGRFSNLYTEKEKRLANNMEGIGTKLKEEPRVIQNILSLLNTIKNRLEEAKGRTVSAYNQKTIEQYLRSGFAADTRRTSSGAVIDDLRIIKNPSQVRTAFASVADLIWRSNNALHKENATLQNEFKEDVLILSNAVDENIKEALYSFMSEEPFVTKAQKIKIMTVGVPSGFSQALNERFRTNNIDDNILKNKELDIVYINVYKRDLRFEDLVFKPKKFIFDLSLFQAQQFIASMNIAPGDNFSSILRNNTLTDLVDFQNCLQSYKYADIKNVEKYKFLKDEARTLFKNHTASFLLETYIMMSTGMKINEETFLVDEEGTRRRQFAEEKLLEILVGYIKNVLNKNIPTNQTAEQLIQNPNIDEGTKELINEVCFGNVINNPRTLKDRAIRPKMFDRVFHFPINIDDFEIDLAETARTTPGQRALEKAEIQNQFIRINDNTAKLISRSENDIVFEDYFITISNKR